MTSPSTDGPGETFLRLDEGIDRAILFSTRRYMQERDFLRDRFIAILGHDLRGPLAAATVAVTMTLESGTLGPADKKRLTTASSSLARMTSMVADVLDFARGHLAGGIPVTPHSSDMAEICRAAIEEARTTHPARALDLRVSGDLRGHFERARVLQALGNLVANAITHGNDPIVIDAFETNDRQSIITRVSNATRAPIPAGVAAKLFRP